MERAARKLQDRIELQLQLKDRPIPPLIEPQPNRSREESIEPWELVSV